MPTDSPGLTVRGITNLDGRDEYPEMFFENVRVPASHLVGQLNKGWTIAKRLLEHERKGIGGIGARAAAKFEMPVEQIAKKYVGETDGRIADPILRDHIAAYAIDAHAFQLTRRRAAEEAESGAPPGPLSAMFKYYATELNKRRYEMVLESEGFQGLGWEGEGFTDDELRLTREWLRSKANSIEGGTSEIQLNIIAKRVLGLPD